MMTARKEINKKSIDFCAKKSICGGHAEDTLMHKKKTTFNQNHSHRKDPHRRHATTSDCVIACLTAV